MKKANFAFYTNKIQLENPELKKNRSHMFLLLVHACAYNDLFERKKFGSHVLTYELKF